MLTILISILNSQFGILFSWFPYIISLYKCFCFFSIMKCVYLEVGHSHCCDHSKHNKEHASNDRLWDGDKNCSKFSKYSQDDHQNTSCLDDQSAANLGKNQHRKLLSSMSMDCNSYLHILWGKSSISNKHCKSYKQ